ISKQMTELENTEDALVLGTGMSAISSSIICTLRSGDHIVAQKHLYAGTLKLLRDILPSFGITTTFVNQENNKEFSDAIKKNNTKIIYIETPSNPLMKITDMKFIGNLGRRNKILTMIDSTFASPVNQNAAEFGIDVIIQSGTKYLGGHSDLMAGIVCGTKDFISKVWDYSHITGHSISAFDAALLMRGIKTLALRVKKQNENAAGLAEFLKSHKKVDKVFYPGLKSFAQHRLAKSQMKGYGGMLSFEIKASYSQTKKFLESLEMCKISVSLGGVESLVTLPVSMWKPYYTAQQLKTIGLSDSLIRMSVGIENLNDIIKDLEKGFKKI
ncbi:MAG: aminotransferase class I/II-fold pyridoxal phosphate-dependent enzyme, partial [Bacteroidota bacterium]|nr:aminotransferase class I/II-fold pyridoxal phosphate-dependent enzyme [Bacteroidota bacterium]